MYELIKIENTAIGDESVPTVSARELYEFLESKQDFSTWIKKRIEKLRLLENKDYILIPQIYQIKNSRGGDRKSLHYAITLDAAKHIALMENTDRGYEVREYFIECEKKLHRVISPKQHCFLDIIEAEDDIDRLFAIRKLDKTVIKPLEQFKKQALPKVSYYDNVLMSPGLVTITQIAKDGARRSPLSSKQSFFAEYCGMTAIDFNKLLESLHIQYKQSKQWLLYHHYAKEGYTQSSTYITEYGRSKLTTKWTQKGRLFIYEKLKDEGILPICERSSE